MARRRPLFELPCLAWGAALALITFWASPVEALSVDLADPGPSPVGTAHTFAATVTEATGALQYQWKFSDVDELHAGTADMAWTYLQPGHYFVEVQVTDASGATASDFVQHLVHYPLTQKRPTASTSIIYDAARNRVYSVNQDNDTVTSIDPDQLVKASELAVYRKPEALALTPEGKLWVVHQDDYAIAVIDPATFVIESGFRLPYASQPVGLAMSPTGDAAYVTLMALGKLLKLDPKTGTVLAEADVGPKPRGIAVTHDGGQVYVTRFISSDAGGELVKVDAATMQVSARILLKLDDETPYSSTEGRGLPNQLFSVGLTPDGRQAWVPSKKDNIVRGLLRDGEKLAPDQIVRPLVSIIDVATAEELYARRVDLDDRSPPLHVEFTPYGDLAILALGGTNHIEVRSVYRPEEVFTTILEVGAFPRATVLTPQGRLFVQAWLSREVIAYDMSAALERYSKATPTELKRIPAVSSEKLSARVLLGKKVFHDSADRRMTNEGYVTCGACHFEGTDDGRVYDFSDRGEGLRNTLSLLGRGGVKQGPLNWTGNLDEIQDFEHQIRDLFSGTGFIPDEVFHTGTKDQPLGEPKAGVSPELDALAAYVSSLERVNPSPYRNPDGTLTAPAVSGRALFAKLGCDFCHRGAAQTDSAEGALHDVGTIGTNSGKRAGAPLLGLDTPTLLGVWETPPYLHDGSAATLRDVLTTSNATGSHGYIAALTSEQVDELVAYLQQIDDDKPTPTLPFEPARPEPIPGSGGQAGTGGAEPTSGAAGTAPVQVAPARAPSSSCAFKPVSRLPNGQGAELALGLALASLLGMARRRRREGLALALSATLAACSDGAQPTSPEPVSPPSTDSAGGGQGGAGAPSTAGAPASGSGGIVSGGSSSAGMTSGGGAAGVAGAAGTPGGGASGTSGASGAGGGGGAFSYEPIVGEQFDDMLIYEGNPPNFRAGAPKEALNGLGQFTNVSVPMLRRFAMDGGKATGFGYLVFPGGGYSLVDMQLHVAELAKRVAPLGVAVFGLKYRVGGGTTDARRDALLDAKRAIRLVKQNAARWGVDVARLGVIGYSAGSHMTMNLAANFDAGNAGSADAIERHSSRPAFIGLMATWASGSKTSPFQFPNDVPPAFFCHAENDKTAPIELPKAVAGLIAAQGAATKLDFYATGAHSSCHPGDASMEGHDWPLKFWPWVQAVVP